MLTNLQLKKIISYFKGHHGEGKYLLSKNQTK